MEENLEDRYSTPPWEEGPWLIATHENYKPNKLEKQTFRTSHQSYRKTIPQLHRNIVEGSHQGWLILRSLENSMIFSLWNPLSSQLLCLPELPEEEYLLLSACILTSPPDDVSKHETCVLILAFQGGLMFSCRPRMGHTCSWVRESVELDGNKDVTIYAAAVLDGVIYAYADIFNPDSGGFDSRFVCINYANDSVNSITIDLMTTETPESRIEFQTVRIVSHMVESCGIIYFISLYMKSEYDPNSMDIMKVLVWKLDIYQMEWILVESLKHRALLLGPRCCTWCWAGARPSPESFIEENHIYVVADDDKSMYSCNLQDDSYIILLPDPSFLHPFYGPTWFMPPNLQRQEPSIFTNGDIGMFLSECQVQKQVINEKIENAEKTNQEQQAVCFLTELPTDIFQLIYKGMNFFDSMNLRATCKTLQSAYPAATARRRDNSSYPLFMVLRDSNNGTYELLDPLENKSHTISNVHNSTIIFSTIDYCKDGWILVRSSDYLKFLNPFTRELLVYPSDHSIMFYDSIGFSTSPTSEDCLIVGIYGHTTLNICLFEAANKGWNRNEIDNSSPDKDIAFFPNTKTPPIYLKNTFYFLDRDGCLGVLNIIEGDIRWHVHDSPIIITQDSKLNSCYLVELDGELVSVFIGEIGRWIKVFKFDHSYKRWLKLDSLGDYTLFVSCASSMSVVIKEGDMKNRIYLPQRMGDEIVFYSLDTRKYHTTSGSEDFKENFYGMKTQIDCCWI